MRIVHCLIALLFVQPCFSQEVIRKVFNAPNGDRHVYYILASDKSTLHGRYVRTERTSQTEGYYNNGVQDGVWTEYTTHPRKFIRIQGPYKDGKKNGLWTVFISRKKLRTKGYFQNDLPVGYWRFYNKKGEVEEEGNYTNGQRSGRWQFYNEQGELVQEFDYTAKNVIQDITLSSLQQTKFGVIDGADTTLTLLQRPPVYIGGRSKLGQVRIIQIPMEMDSVNVRIRFTIDIAGQVRDYKIVDEMGFPYDQEAMYTLRQLTSTSSWMPAMLNGQLVEVEHILTVSFRKVKLKQSPADFYREYLPERPFYPVRPPGGVELYMLSGLSVYACRVEIL